jgi:hypothetical protein
LVLSNGGDQEPVIPLEEVVGKGAKKAPAQIGGIGGLNTAIVGFTIIWTVFDKAHCPIFGVGVKVYVPEVVLSTVAGLQVPTIPLFEMLFKIGGVFPKQMDVGNVKIGVTLFTTKTVKSKELAHWSGSGVKR